MYLVSIVIPVYNSSKYLRECLNSVLKQDYDEYEVILIDDGSTDDSSEICLEFVNNHNNFIYKKTKNMGVSSARNEGIKMAKGELICFVDSDDILEKHYIRGFVDCLAKYPNADMICACYKTTTNDTPSRYKKIKCAQTDPLSVISNDNGCYLFDKIFKKKIIEENNIIFNKKLKMCEDMIFIKEYLKFCQCIIKINYAGYCYRTNIESASKKIINKDWFTIFDAFDILLNDIDDEKLNYRYVYNLYRGKFRLRYINDDGSIKNNLKNRIGHIRPMTRKFSFKNRIKYLLYKYFWFILFSVKEKK